MGAKASSEGNIRTSSVSETVADGGVSYGARNHAGHTHVRSPRYRTHSLGANTGGGGRYTHPLFVTAGGNVSVGLPVNSSSSTSPRDDERPRSRSLIGSSLPVHVFSIHGFTCPVCSKPVQPDDIECHLIICLTKPKLVYNEDVLTEDKEDECVICLDELRQGDTIARLPCLCVYHKSCIDQWFRINQSCPEHPGD